MRVGQRSGATQALASNQGNKSRSQVASIVNPAQKLDVWRPPEACTGEQNALGGDAVRLASERAAAAAGTLVADEDADLGPNLAQ